MAMNGVEFIRYMDEQHRKQGFADDGEAFGAAFNWKEVFREDLPDNYFHPRDYHFVQEAIAGLRTPPPSKLEMENQNGSLN